LHIQPSNQIIMKHVFFVALVAILASCNTAQNTATTPSDAQPVTPGETMTPSMNQPSTVGAELTQEGQQAVATTPTTTTAQPAPSTGAVKPNPATGTKPAPGAAPTTATSQAPTADVKPTGPTTTVKFDKMKHDFGKLTDGDQGKTVFKFTNTGTVPLIISSAKGSCGCTVPDYPKQPIAPGETGEINVTYNSTGKGTPEGKDEKKSVTIVANTAPSPIVLQIAANVTKKG
jgi:Protein of unknown function (DUF1573)